MKFALSTSAVLALCSVATAVNVRYDAYYGYQSNSLDGVACSNGANGLETRYGFKTLRDIPTFPNIGAAQAIAGWNSTSCGSCWKLTYKGKSIIVTAVDHAGDGFNIAEQAMNTLTNGQAEQLGVVDATAVQVPASQCGL